MITDDEWQAFDRFEVPQPEQEELKAVVESTKEAIVVAPFEEGPAPRRVERGSPRRRCPGGAPFGGVRLVASCELCQRGGRCARSRCMTVPRQIFPDNASDRFAAADAIVMRRWRIGVRRPPTPRPLLQATSSRRPAP